MKQEYLSKKEKVQKWVNMAGGEKRVGAIVLLENNNIDCHIKLVSEKSLKRLRPQTLEKHPVQFWIVF